MTELPLTSEFETFRARPDSAVEGGLLIARVLDAEADIDWVRAEFERLAGQHAGADAGALVSGLREAGFKGAESYYAAENSSIETVLRTRRGIPISLALVVIGVAECLGLAARGVNFPRHFLVRVEHALVDPFAMQVLEREEVEQQLAAQGIAAAQVLADAGPMDIVLRMLNNLRLIAEQHNDRARALDLIGYQLVLVPDSVPLRVERADLWLALGVPHMAAHELDRALERVDDEGQRRALAERRARIMSTPSRLH